MGKGCRNRGNRMHRNIKRAKKDASATVHMPQVAKDQLVELAEQQRAGQGASEYIFENLIIPHLQQLEHETKIRQKIFGLTGSE